jgi:hypothetical protein
MWATRSRVLLALLAAGLAGVAAGCGGAPPSPPTTTTTPPAASALPGPAPTGQAGVIGRYLSDQTRTAKARLIQQLTSPPGVVVFGGSRAMRIDPAYIKQRTGLSGFNAAVTQARPEDTWALLNLLHARFPAARFRFLWVLHADEFGARPIDLAILMNPALARFFPASLVKSQLPQAIALAKGGGPAVKIDIQKRGSLAYAPNGFVTSGFFGNATPPPNGNVGAVDANIRKELLIYGSTPSVFYPRPLKYFQKDLRLMDSLAAAPPVIVAAPFDQRIYQATVNRGWGTRHQLLLALLNKLQSADHFSFLDLSKAWQYGFTPSDFYDGIHLTPQGGNRLIDLVLQKFPGSL